MFQWLIVHTVTIAALAGVVAAASRWLRLGPAARHLLWLILLVKFLTPPVVYWPWALPMLSAVPAVALPTTTAPDAPLMGDVRTIIIDMPPGFGPEPDAADPPPVIEQPAVPSFSWDWLPATAGWTWLVGGVLIALLQATRILRWRRRLGRGASAPDGVETLVRELAGAMGLRPPRLTLVSSLSSPMVWCFGVPRLLWPSGLEDRLSAEACRAVLLHELAHLRRRDHWVGWLLLAGGIVWWWHPLFWWVRRRLGQEAELACDAWVVGAAPDARRAYAEALLEVSQRMSAAVAVPALGATGGRRDLERRLVMIMRGPTSHRLSWVGLAGAIALGLLALPAWTLGGDKTPLPTVSTPPPMAVTEAPPAQAAPPTAADPLLSPDAAPRTPPVPSQPAAPGSSATKDPGAWQRDRKLKELDDKVQQLLKEMQQLRGRAPASGTGGPLPPSPNESLIRIFQATPQPGLSAPSPAPVESTTEVITLTRVSYKLKPATAEALSTFLKENVKSAILETKNEGESLVVTTTPEAQQAIAQFVHLLQGDIKGPLPKTNRLYFKPAAAAVPPSDPPPLPPSPAVPATPPAPRSDPRQGDDRPFGP